MSMGGYPMGAQYDPRAPWNQEPPKKVSIPICISVTYHKDIEVEVTGDYDEVVLNQLARKAIYNTHKHMDDNNWVEDEFVVIED